MSRQSSNSESPENSPLPRRRFLQAMTAALPAAVMIPSPGQAFSSPDTVELIPTDPRLDEVDRMICDVNETCIAQAAASNNEEETNDDGANIFDLETEKWTAAQNALVEYGDKLAAEVGVAPQISDALVLTKIADFQLRNYGPDADIMNQERAVPIALRTVLLAHGIAPTEQTAMTVQQAELAARIANRPPAPPQIPSGASVGSIIARIRSLGQARIAALRYEGSLPNGTPEASRAAAVSDRRIADLEALRDEIIAGLSAPYDPRSPNASYHLAPVEEHAVLVELVDAMCPGFWKDSRHGDISPVLRELRKAVTCRSDYWIEQAERWNASQGGANA